MINYLTIAPVISFLGVIFILILKDQKKDANQILVYFFAFFTIRYLLELIPALQSIKQISVFLSTFGQSHLFFVFLYIKYITSASKKFKKTDLFFLSPIIVLYVYIIFTDLSTFNIYLHSPPLHYQIIGYSFICLWGFYTTLCIRILLKHRSEIRNYYSDESAKILLNWVWGIIIYYIAIYLSITIIYRININLSHEIIPVKAFLEVNEITMLIIILIFGIWQDDILPTISQAKDKYAKSGLKNKDLIQIQSQLERYMLKQKPYLENNLSIEELAKRLNVKRHYLTEVISTSYNKNFFNFIKEYRVNHVIELMKQEEYKNVKILYLAFESGFNSKSVFNKTFKEITGKTPSEYLAEIRKRMYNVL